MKIDVFCHILPPKYFAELQKKARPGFNFVRDSPTPKNSSGNSIVIQPFTAAPPL